MKKYIVKYKESGKVYGEYSSRKEASDKLMEHIHNFNKYFEGEYLSPFDFVLEVVECKEVNEVITDFESAKRYLNLKGSNEKNIAALIALDQFLLLQRHGTRQMALFQISLIVVKTSGFLGSKTTRILRCLCVRIRITRQRLLVQVSVADFASRQGNAQSNSASNSTTFTTRLSFNTDERNKLLTKLK